MLNNKETTIQDRFSDFHLDRMALYSQWHHFAEANLYNNQHASQKPHYVIYEALRRWKGYLRE